MTTTPKTLPERLRYLLRGKRHHFTTAAGVQLMAVVGTVEQIEDIERAAGELDAAALKERQENAKAMQDAIQRMEDEANGKQGPISMMSLPVSALAREQVREAALAELATWERGAPGGPTAYEVTHSICRRLGVVL